MPSALLMGGTLALTTCIAMQTVVVSPRPVTRSDSAAALSLLEQMARENDLEPDVQPSNWQREWTECFKQERWRFKMCGRMEDSVVRVQFLQGGRFYDRGDEVRRAVIEKLRSRFGETRVRECTFTWRGREVCPAFGPGQ